MVSPWAALVTLGATSSADGDMVAALGCSLDVEGFVVRVASAAGFFFFERKISKIDM
jgi:hypothetical protein